MQINNPNGARAIRARVNGDRPALGRLLLPSAKGENSWVELKREQGGVANAESEADRLAGDRRKVT